MLKGELSGDTPAVGYCSRGLETLVLEGELSGDTAAGSYRSRGMERPVLEGEPSGIQQQEAIEI